MIGQFKEGDKVTLVADPESGTPAQRATVLGPLNNGVHMVRIHSGDRLSDDIDGLTEVPVGQMRLGWKRQWRI